MWPQSTHVPLIPWLVKKFRSVLINSKTETNTFAKCSHVLAGDWGLSRACEIIVWKAGLQIGWVWRPRVCQSFHCFYGTDACCQKTRRVRRSLQIERDRKTNKYLHRNIKPGWINPTIKLLWREKGTANLLNVRCLWPCTFSINDPSGRGAEHCLTHHVFVFQSQSKEKQNNLTEAEMSADELFVSSPFHKSLYILPVPVIGRER